jgi:diguanylate cyclase (GGDEF)-like protein/PAS domain S-box-containing protein
MLSVGSGVAAALGMTRKALQAEPLLFARLIDQDDKQILRKMFAEPRKKATGTVKLRVRNGKGAVRPLHWAWAWDERGKASSLELTLKQKKAPKRSTARALRDSEAALAESQNLLRLFIEHAPAALAMLDREMRYVSASRRWFKDYGLEGRSIVGVSHYEIFPDIPERWREAHRKGLAGQAQRLEEERFVRADGTVQWLRRELIPWHAADGSVGGIILFGEDITGLKQSAERLQLAASVFTHASEGIFITDGVGTVLDVNAAFTRITGYTREEMVGCNARVLNSGRQTREFYEEMWASLIEKGHWSGEIWNRAKSGQIFAEMLTISAVPDETGKAKQFVALFSDITLQKEREQQLLRVAHYDLLTGLPNRVLLADRLRQAMAQAHRGGWQVAVACLDLDDFRAVNDLHGHSVGDELLMAITHRMSQVLREGDTLARLGGDEFVAVLLDKSEAEQSRELVKKLIEAASRPVRVEERRLKVAASVGMTLYPQAEDIGADQLLRQADQAMYHAKLAGKGKLHIFDPARDRNERGHHEDLNRLGAALEANEFLLYYQPKVNMRTGAILGVEALVRWNHPEQGLLSPGQFLPVMSEAPLVVKLGEWVLFQALKQVQKWRQEGLDLPVSVNIDAQQLQQADFVERLKALLAEHSSVSPTRLELEVLESSALEDVAQVSQVMRACSRMGIRFALDDFGTGYSSLAYLRRLPVHVLKIDQTFVHDMLDDPEDLTILEGVLGLANAFRHLAVAEGVETVEHGEMLLRMGCLVGQGYVISRPLPGDEVVAWARTWRPDPRWAAAGPLDPEDFPMLYAAVEHRSWVRSVEEALSDRRQSAPEIDTHVCRFGLWMDAQLVAGGRGENGLRAIASQHERIHAYVKELFQIKAKQGRESALAGLVRLYKMRDALVERLKVLVDVT